MTKKFQFTKTGHQKLLSELEHLKSTKHPAAKERLSKARQMGDLRENSEYHAAKEDLGVIVGRISELEEMLRWAEVIEETIEKIEMDLVRLGCKVVVEKEGKQDEYHIVGDFEADPLQKKISHTSPIGKALVGKKRGDQIEVIIPSGKHVYTVVDIRQA